MRSSKLKDVNVLQSKDPCRFQQFNSIQDDVYALGKEHMRFTLRSFSMLTNVSKSSFY